MVNVIDICNVQNTNLIVIERAANWYAETDKIKNALNLKAGLFCYSSQLGCREMFKSSAECEKRKRLQN